MGSYLSGWFTSKEAPKPPTPSMSDRLSNLAYNNYRGIVGSAPLILILWFAERGNNRRTVTLMWLWMFWSFLIQPVAPTVVGMITLFVLPMAGVLDSNVVCKCFMNENIVLYVISGMLVLLLNNSGADRRIALWFLSSGDSNQYTAKRIVYKCSAASYFLSMFSNRLIATSTLCQYMTPVFSQLQSSLSKGSAEPDYQQMNYIVSNAIQTSSAIGSIGILHSAYVTMLFRAIFAEAPYRDKEYPDIFNYLQYSVFAFPLSLIMFILNAFYHMFLVGRLGKSMSSSSMSVVQDSVSKNKADLPSEVTLHEKLTIVSLVLVLLMFFLRWNRWIGGWSTFRKDPDSPEIPRVKDATVAAIFLIMFHIIPKGYGFMKYISASKKSQLPPIKPESGILWWRFVDKNTNYGFFLLFGSGIALVHASRETGLAREISENIGLIITNKPWNVGIFLVVFITALLANLMSSMAVCTIFLPFVMSMGADAAHPWPTSLYCAALGVGVASSFGFCVPHQYTPGFFSRMHGKVPVAKMIMLSLVPVCMCTVLLWLALIIWAPFLFDPHNHGIVPVNAPGVAPTPPSGEPPAP